MSQSDIRTEQLEAYLDTLTPDMARVLIQEVEKDKAAGGTKYPHDFMLRRAREILKDTPVKAERQKTARRVFCEPFDDLLTDAVFDNKQKGRTCRQSIMPIWNLLQEEPHKSVINGIDVQIDKAFIEKDRDALKKLIPEFYARIVKTLEPQFLGIEPETQDYMRLSSKLGGVQTVEDAREIISCMKNAPHILRLRASLPMIIDEVNEITLKRLILIYKKFAQPMSSLMHLPLLLMMRRMEKKAEIIRVVCKLLGTDNDIKLAGSPFAVIGDCILHDLQIEADAIKKLSYEKTDADKIIQAISSFHQLASGFDAEIDLSTKGKWGWRLVSMRKEASEIIRDQIISAPRLVKAALFRKKSGSDGGENIMGPREQDLREAEYAVKLLLGIRPFSSYVGAHKARQKNAKLVTYQEMQQRLLKISSRFNLKTYCPKAQTSVLNLTHDTMDHICCHDSSCFYLPSETF